MADEGTAPDLRPDHVRRGATGPGAPPREQLGRYQLLFELARGGMGTVHVARLVGTHGFDRVFALKRPLPGAPAGEAAAVAAFLDEARIAAKLHHPNVVETLDLGEHDGAPFLVMTLVPGVSLARLLGRLGERGERLDPWLVAWIAHEVAAGLHAAHELRGDRGEPLGLVHRDVSPENVLLSFEGRPMVMDFGVAKWRLAASRTEAGVTKGKLAYMAPEQTRAGPVDRRADVFALGVVAYEALVGHRLFAGDTPAETLRRVLEHEPPDPHAERPEIPPDLAALVLRCLRKDPPERPSTAGEVAAELRALWRREQRVVDGIDLAAVIARAFPGERERLAERIARASRAEPMAGSGSGAVPGDSKPPETGESADAAERGDAADLPEPHASTTATETATALPARPAPGRGRVRAFVLAGLGAALAVGMLLVFTHGGSSASSGSPPGGPAGAVSPSVARGHTLSVSSTSSTSSPASTDALGGPSASAASGSSADASASSAPTAGASAPQPPEPGSGASGAAVRPPAPPSQASAPASTSSAAPPPAASPGAPSSSAVKQAPSNKGVPFKSLDL